MLAGCEASPPQPLARSLRQKAWVQRQPHPTCSCLTFATAALLFFHPSLLHFLTCWLVPFSMIQTSGFCWISFPVTKIIIIKTRWEPLLLQSFSPPTLEQDGDTPSYGLLLALANVAVRGAAREAGGARSPSPSNRNCTASPGRPASAPPPDSIERRRLGLVLERVTTLLLEQVNHQ